MKTAVAVAILLVVAYAVAAAVADAIAAWRTRRATRKLLQRSAWEACRYALHKKRGEQ